jgi:DNA-binding MarR family transcriptional regulator
MGDDRPSGARLAAADLGVDVVATLPPALVPFLGHVLNHVHARSAAIGVTTLPADRHPSEMAVLTAIEAVGPASQRLLGERLGINRTIMVRIIDRLEAESLVTRGPDVKDRRHHAVTLTASGRRMNAELDAAAEAHSAALTRALGAAGRKRLDGLLRTLLATAPNGLPDLPPKLAGRTGFLVARCLFVVRAAEGAALAPLGLKPRHFAALAVLDDIGPCAQQRLADNLGVSNTIVVQLADRLEELGLVERRAVRGDRRVQLLTVTSPGARVLGTARRVVRDTDDQLTEPLGAQGAQQLRRLLLQLLEPT